VTKILELPEGQEVAVIGTLYKEMKLKPSILDEYNKVGPSCQATCLLHCPAHEMHNFQALEPRVKPAQSPLPVQYPTTI
jgi:hypothetical protein